MPDAAEAAIAGGDFRFQHGPRRLAQQEIDVADDAGADRGRTVAAACAHRSRAIGEFNFAHGAQGLRSAGAVHRAGLDIDGRDDVVAGGDVGGDILDQIALAAAIPEMMMRVDDRARGIDDLFRALGEPVLAWIGIEPALGGG